MLLRSVATLLRKLGHDVEIETYHCDFSAAVGEEGVAKTPAGLAPFVGETPPVHDFHHAVRLSGCVDGVLNSEGILLDATWPDCLAAPGFRVNTGWAGPQDGDTALAVPSSAVFQEFGAVGLEHLGSLKAALVATLRAEEQERRTRFFSELTAWLPHFQDS